MSLKYDSGDEVFNVFVMVNIIRDTSNDYVDINVVANGNIYIDVVQNRI